MKKMFFLLLAFIAVQQISAQKKTLDHSVYDRWQSVQGAQISDDGKWVVYMVNPQEGDGDLIIQSTDGNYKKTIARGYSSIITNDSRFVIFKIRPLFKDTRDARIKKKRPDDMPKDSLAIVELGKDSVWKVARVKTFKTPEKGNGWVAYHMDKVLPEPPKPAAKPDSITQINKMVSMADSLMRVADSLKNKAKWIYRKNSRDDLFEAKIYFPTGSNQSKTIVFAADLLQRCGTDSLSAQQISELWYNMGVSYSVAVGSNHTVVSFKGLTKQLEPAIQLFLHQLKYCVVNEEIFQAVKESVIQSRNNILTSKKELMWTGMRDYLVYGENSPLKFQLSNSEIQNLKAKDLISEIQKTLKTPNQFTYYGEYEVETVENIWTKYFDTKSPAQKLYKDFNRLETAKTELFFIDQNSQQAEILLLSKGAPMQTKDWAIHELFNEYFGGSMSSIVFQELREKQALAYQVYASYASPKKANDSRYIIAYIGTQADKYFDALVGMKNLLDNLIIDSVKFEQSKLALIQRIESERIPEYSAIAMYLNAQEQGVPLNKNQILYNEHFSLYQ